MPTQPDYDVAVVGCGPVGAIFANLLSAYGRRIAIAEKAAEIYDKPRAIEARELWQHIGGEFLVVTPDPIKKCRDIVTVSETQDLFALWLKANDVSAVIVRPDRYVFGGAKNATELNSLVRELASKLA